MIEYFINKEVDLECKTKDGLKPIYFISKFQN